MPDVIMPRKCVAELYRLLEEVEGTVEVSLSPTKVRFGLGSAVLTSKLIDGTFPDYNRVIPTANDKLLKLDPKSFSAGVDRVSTIASREDPRGQDERRPRQGDAVGDLARERRRDRGGAGGLRLRRDRDRLQRPLSARHPREIDGDMVEVHLADAAAPTLLRENDKSNALYVLMPMRV